MENIGIVDLKYKSCASLTIQCLAEVGIADRRTAFKRHIENAKSLGLMPDDQKVIRATLADYGFQMQSTHVEGIRLAEVIALLSSVIDAPASVFVAIQCYEHLGGYMLALQTDGTHWFKPFFPYDRPDYPEVRDVAHVWIRWDDGIDRSPYPRKSTHRNALSRTMRVAKNTEFYQHFQPNPCGNYIGDCVVRGISGALDISWCEAMNRLASAGEPTVNSRTIYPEILRREGFVRYNPIVKNGHRLNGIDFCKEMENRYHHGERIFAHVGRCHVAAIVPTAGTSGYKILDSWDSSQRRIGEYWVKFVKNTPVTPEKDDTLPFLVGDVISHPSFGKGIVSAVGVGVLTVDFSENGVHRLGEDWVRRSCTRTVA